MNKATSKKESFAEEERPWGLDDILNCEDHEILVEKSDLMITGRHKSTTQKIFKNLTFKDGNYYLILPKLYALSVGESGDIEKITINRIQYIIAYQNLVKEIAAKTKLKPKIVTKMLSEPWKYDAKYPILKQKKQEISEAMSRLQSTDQDQAEVTIVLKNRLIKDWSSIDTGRLGATLFNKISSYIFNENYAWEKPKALEYSESDLALLQQAEEESLALSSVDEQLALSSGGEEAEDPIAALNPSNKTLSNSGKNLTIETTAQAS